MSPYEELLKIMRREGSKDNPPAIQVGIMDGPNSCNIGELKLSRDDLLIAEHLATGYHIAVCGEDPSRKDDSTFREGLAKGDKVAVYRVSDSLYIILERLV